MNVNFPPLPRGSIAIRMARLAFSLLVYSSVAASAQSTTHLDFSYADRTALLNAAWSYTATTALEEHATPSSQAHSQCRTTKRLIREPFGFHWDRVRCGRMRTIRKTCSFVLCPRIGAVFVCILPRLILSLRIRR